LVNTCKNNNTNSIYFLKPYKPWYNQIIILLKRVLNKQTLFSVVTKRKHRCRRKTIRTIHRIYHAREVNSAYYIIIFGLSASTAYHKVYRFRKGTPQRIMFWICTTFVKNILILRITIHVRPFTLFNRI